MNVAVTGCNTLIGRTMVEQLIKDGHTVKGYDIFIPKNYPHKITPYQGKLENNTELENFCKDSDTIIHLMEVRHYENKPNKYMKNININGTKNLAKLSVQTGVNNFIYLSSYEVYGKSPQVPIRITDKTRPQNKYGKQKLIAEKIIRKLGEESEVKTTIMRPALVIGKNTDNPIILISLYMAMAQGNDNKLYLMGNGDTRFQMIHPKDIAKAISLAVSNPNSWGKIYNIGSDQVPTQIEQLVKMKDVGKLDCSIKHISKLKTKILSFILSPLNINYLSKEHLTFIFQNKLLDNHLAKDELDWTPTMTNLDILDELISWYREKYEADRF